MNTDDYDFSYDSIAARYAAKVDSAPYNALYERPAMLSVLPDVDGSRVLDAGCGSGWYACELLARGATVDAIDASASMVEHARQRFLGLPADQQDRIDVSVADLEAPLAFGDECFDGIVSPLVMHYIRDWRPALTEMNRVLKPDGWLLFSTHHPSADASHFATSNYFATEHVRDHWDWVGDVEFYRRSLTEISASIRDGGFYIDNMMEPAPTDEFRIAEPESYERLVRQPEFLVILARKEPGERSLRH